MRAMLKRGFKTGWTSRVLALVMNDQIPIDRYEARLRAGVKSTYSICFGKISQCDIEDESGLGNRTVQQTRWDLSEERTG